MPSSHDRKTTTALRHSIHGQSRDYTIHLSVALQIPVPVVEKAKELHEAMLKHPLWDNRRTPHGLLVDCLYVTANRSGHRITVKRMVEVSKKVLYDRINLMTLSRSFCTPDRSPVESKTAF